jgi:hypothetical protein
VPSAGARQVGSTAQGEIHQAQAHVNEIRDALRTSAAYRQQYAENLRNMGITREVAQARAAAWERAAAVQGAENAYARAQAALWRLYANLL